MSLFTKRNFTIALLLLFALVWFGHRVASVHKRLQGVLAVVHVSGPIRTSWKSMMNS
jgi:hypothetical protein